MADTELLKENPAERQWENFLDPKVASDDLLITEFDPFKDFVAIYCKRDGRPEIIIHDLNTQKYSIINVNNDIGAIGAGMNQDYDTKTLNFHF